MKKNKKKIIIISILSAILIFGCITFIIFNNLNKKEKEYKLEIEEIQKQNESAFKEYSNNIEYMTSWTKTDMLNNLIDEEKISKDTEIVIKINDEEFKDEEYVFNEVKNIKITVIFNKLYEYKVYKKKKEIITNEKIYNLDVIDSIKPVISGISNKEITLGDEINLLEGITAYDDVEGEIAVKVNNEVDLSTVGEHEVYVSATDKNGNETIESFKVTVKEKKKVTTSTNNNTTNNNELTQQEKERQARVIAKQIASSITGNTDLEKVSKAAQIVSEYYQKGVHKESGVDYRTAYGVFIKGESSCAGTTRALGMVLEEMGYSWTHANENQWNHQWVILYMDGQIGYADGQIGLVGYGKHPVAEE